MGISARSADLETEKEKGRVILTKTKRHRKGSFSNPIEETIKNKNLQANKNNNHITKLFQIKNENIKFKSKTSYDNSNEITIKNSHFEKVDMVKKKDIIQISSLEEKIIESDQTKESTRLITQELKNFKTEPMIYIPKKLREIPKPSESFYEKKSFELKTEQ